MGLGVIPNPYTSGAAGAKIEERTAGSKIVIDTRAQKA